jgi:hypothetical protein
MSTTRKSLYQDDEIDDESADQSEPPFFNEFVIEVRETIARIVPGGGGEHPLAVAFKAIGEWYQKNLDGEGQHIQFSLWGQTFHIHHEDDK